MKFLKSIFEYGLETPSDVQIKSFSSLLETLEADGLVSTATKRRVE